MISKAVIPCGGMGTRFLPITKAVPKELLPIIDKPCLAYIVDELVASGITSVMIISAPGKEAIERYFTFDERFYDKLMESGKTDEAEMLRKISQEAEIVFTYQMSPRGSGDAIYQAKDFVGNDAFALALGDDMVISEEPCAHQLMRAYEKTGKTIVGVQRWETDDIVNYGVADIEYSDGRLHKCREIKEKPSLNELPSRLACLGRYVITSDIFPILENQKPGKNGEIQLTDALNTLGKKGMYVYEFEGRRYDMGDKFGAMTANVECALKSSFGARFELYLTDLLKSLKK